MEVVYVEDYNWYWESSGAVKRLDGSYNIYWNFDAYAFGLKMLTIRIDMSVIMNDERAQDLSKERNFDFVIKYLRSYNFPVHIEVTRYGWIRNTITKIAMLQSRTSINALTSLSDS